MGSCFSKKTTMCSSSTTAALPDPPDQKPKLSPQPQPQPQPQVAEKKKSEEETTTKKEIFLIKHRISHDSSDRKSDEEKHKSDPKCDTPSTITTTSEAGDVGSSNLMSGGIVVRTSSCSKEEIDAILIQCGRLSRSSSTGKAAGGCSGGRKYSGSKRSYDFDHEKGNGNDDDDDVIGGGDEAVEAERTHRHRQRHRQSTPSSSSGRRRTPSRERDQQNQRSGSRERGSGSSGGGRRVSRSPGRRSESPMTGNTNTNTTTNTTNRPGKMVSVPATVSSMAMDKSGIGGVEPPSAAAIKRISVKRNVGAASPRARSPAAATRVSNEKQNTQSNQPLSLSRSNSRKAEQSPYRRNPLGEIDQNCMAVELPINKGSNNIVSQAPTQKPNSENVKSNKNIGQGTENKTNSVRAREEQQQKMEDEGKPLQPYTGNVTVTMVPSGPESHKPQMLTRTRSSRLSRDLDINPETLLNPSPTSSYTALLLEDIQNFHQKSTPVIPCLTKACSILEAVADLNSTTISNLSTAEQFGKKKRLETKEPFVESEVIGCDDLMEPSFQKYVTVSRGGGGGGGGDMEEVESSGSNSFIGGGQSWVSSSLWEPNSADSTDSWNPLRLGEKKLEGDRKHNGIGRGRVGSGRSLQSPTLKAASLS